MMHQCRSVVQRRVLSAKRTVSLHHQHASFSTVNLYTQQYPSIKSAEPYRTPIVIVHGLLGSSNNWRGIASRPEISHNRHVYGVDVRNHGQSPHTDSMQYSDMSADIVKVLDKRGIDKCILIGHSLGGKIAMTTALTQPDRITQLVVVDMSPAPFTYKRDQDWLTVGSIVDACVKVDLQNCKSRDDCDKALSGDIPERAVRQFVLQNLVFKHDTKQWHWRVNLPAIQSAMNDIAAFKYNDPDKYHFDKPTLFVAGGKSNYIRPQHYDLIRSLFTQCQIDTVPDAGHWVHVEQPQNFVKLVGDFIDQHDK